VNASIQGEALRVSGGKKDDLQAVMAALRASPPGYRCVYELSVTTASRTSRCERRHARFAAQCHPLSVTSSNRPDGLYRCFHHGNRVISDSKTRGCNGAGIIPISDK